MKIIKKAVLMIFLVVYGNIQLCAQSLYPSFFLQIQNNYAFDNPAASSTYEYRDFRVMNSFYTGLLKNVGVYYVDASCKINSKNAVIHTPGFVVHTEYETDLLKRTRVYFRYAIQISLNDKLKLSAGIAAGVFNYSVKGTNSSAGTSAFAPDGNLGLWLHGKKINAGIAADQIFASEVAPVNYKFTLARYAALIFDYKVDLSARTNIVFVAKSYLGGKGIAGMQGGVICNIIPNVSAGLLYYYNKGFGGNLMLKELKIDSIYGELSFTYFQPSAYLNTLNSNRMEIMLRFFLRNNNREK
ncbi:MAG TPA: type IX secretion system membrane protein PorP/SprF [Cytophaga sp.]|nr:type IX secretion system membrane protein PorP/SprF [Cytophaga sp.]